MSRWPRITWLSAWRQPAICAATTCAPPAVEAQCLPSLPCTPSLFRAAALALAAAPVYNVHRLLAAGPFHRQACGACARAAHLHLGLEGRQQRGVGQVGRIQHKGRRQQAVEQLAAGALRAPDALRVSSTAAGGARQGARQGSTARPGLLHEHRTSCRALEPRRAAGARPWPRQQGELQHKRMQSGQGSSTNACIIYMPIGMFILLEPSS